MLLHVHIGDLDVLVWFGDVNELDDYILVGAFFMDRYD